MVAIPNQIQYQHENLFNRVELGMKKDLNLDNHNHCLKAKYYFLINFIISLNGFASADPRRGAETWSRPPSIV